MSKNKILTITAAVIFVGAVIWSAVIMLRSEGEVVTITQDGKLLYTLDLSKEQDRTITVEYKGRKNIIEISNGRIKMKEAECPDHICIETGWLKDVPIVCLPNRLVIEYADSGSNDVEAR